MADNWSKIDYVYGMNTKNDTIDNPLDWYMLTETANSILNELIAYTGRERGKERRKDNPDLQRLETLWNLFKEINAVNRNVDNFKSHAKMREIIKTYGPMIRLVNDGGQLV